LKHSKLFEGMLAQAIDVHPGGSVAVIFSCLPEEIIKQMTSLNMSLMTWTVKNR